MTAVSCERRSAAALSSVNRPARYELSHNIRFANMVEPMFDASDCGAGWIFSLVRDVAAGGATTSRGGSWQPRMRKRSRNEIASCSALQIPRLAFQDWRPQTLLAPKSTPAQWLGSLELGPGKLASCGRHCPLCAGCAQSLLVCLSTPVGRGFRGRGRKLAGSSDAFSDTGEPGQVENRFMADAALVGRWPSCRPLKVSTAAERSVGR